MTVDPRLYQDLGIVTRIDDSEIEEVSMVDDPATDIEFSMFKSIEKAPGLADVEACLRNDVATPTECESQSEGWGNLLRADVRSHEDSGSPPERTEAIKGEPMEKIDALAGDPGVPPPPPPADANPAPSDSGPIEIPATPIDWSLSKCIDAGVKLGLSEDQAGQACMVVREQYGAAGEEGKILVPDGVKPEALLGAAAADLGFATLAGKAATAKRQPPDPKAYRGIGTYWADKWNRFLGRKTNRPGEELARYLKGLEARSKALEGRLEELMSENTKRGEDLRLALRMQDRVNRRQAELLAAALNVKLPDEEEFDPEPATAGTEAAPAAPPSAPNPLMTDGKRKGSKACHKCGEPVADVAPAPEAKTELVAPTDGDRISRLEQLVEQLVAAATGAPPDGIDDNADELDQLDEAELIEETLAAAGAAVPGKRASAVTPLEARRAQIKASAISGLNGGLPKGYSRGFTGMVIADADRETVRRTRNVSGLHIKR